jgi:hypothetical protein
MHSALIDVSLEQDGRRLDSFFAKVKALAAQSLKGVGV